MPVSNKEFKAVHSEMGEDGSKLRLREARNLFTRSSLMLCAGQYAAATFEAHAGGRESRPRIIVTRRRTPKQQVEAEELAIKLVMDDQKCMRREAIRLLTDPEIGGVDYVSVRSGIRTSQPVTRTSCDHCGGSRWEGVNPAPLPRRDGQKNFYDRAITIELRADDGGCHRCSEPFLDEAYDFYEDDVERLQSESDGVSS